jgi:trehalose-phosphatase
VQFPVAVVSGRSVEDIQRKVGLAGIYYAGSHGYEIVGPDGERMEDDSFAGFGEYLEPLQAVAAMLEDELAPVSGADVERKPFAVAVHFRRAEEAALPGIAAVVRAAGDGFPQLRVGHGKKIFEFRPAHEWDKGKAVSWICRRLSEPGGAVLPVYLGDDTTDEDAFGVVDGAGIGIVVGRDGPPTLAAYLLEDPEAVSAFLRRISDGGSGSGVD